MFFVLIVGTIGITIDIVCSCIYNEIIKCIRIHFMAQKSNISLRKISKDKDQGYFFLDNNVYVYITKPWKESE